MSRMQADADSVVQKAYAAVTRNITHEAQFYTININQLVGALATGTVHEMEALGMIIGNVRAQLTDGAHDWAELLLKSLNFELFRRRMEMYGQSTEALLLAYHKDGAC